MIEPIDFLAASTQIVAPALAGAAPTVAPAVSGPGSFGQWFTAQVGKVEGQLEQADQNLAALATGEAQNLHQVMISLEEARLSFQMLLQVRNRALEAYQDVMRMQV